MKVTLQSNPGHHVGLGETHTVYINDVPLVLPYNAETEVTDAQWEALKTMHLVFSVAETSSRSQPGGAATLSPEDQGRAQQKADEDRRAAQQKAADEAEADRRGSQGKGPHAR
jgi:hypothetical protein